MRKRSNLNPYAAAYVPVSIRESRTRNSVTEGSPRNYNGNIWSQTSQQITNNQQLDYANALRLSPVKNQPQPASSSCISPSRSSTPFYVGLWCLDEYWYYSLFTLTMRRQISHMIKHRYVPFTFGKQRYCKRASAESTSLPVVD